MSGQDTQFVITFDVGGSHVGAGLCRLSDLAIVRRSTGLLSNIAGFDGFVTLLHELGAEAAAGEANVVGASLAMPGPFDYENGISLMQHKLEYLFKQDLRAALALRFGWKPGQVRFLNDAASYVLGEVGAGSLKGTARSAGLTLGTGVGCAFVANGRHLTSGEGVPPGGEIWNLPYEGGTVEDLISTRWIKTAYTVKTGAKKEVLEIAEAASASRNAREVFEEFGSNLGRVLRDVIAPFKPERVMIGGGIARSAQLFLPAVEQQVRGLGFGVVLATLGDEAPLAGAAQYWRETSA